MKVKFLKSGCSFGYGYLAGAEADMPASDAAKLIDLQICAVAVETTNGCELPADIPCFDELEKLGIKSIDDLAKITDLTKLKDIGSAKAKLITEYISNINQ